MFSKITRSIQRFHREDIAATAVEYAVMLACIVLIAMKSLQLCGFEIRAVYQLSADVLGGSAP